MIATTAAAPALIVRIESVPSPDLSPNARVSWRRRHAAGRALRDATALAVRSALLGTDPPALRPGERFRLDWRIAWGKGRRPLDDDNAIASCKAIRDQLAREIGIDDRRMVTGTVDQGRDERGHGFTLVAVRIEQGGPA